MKPTVSIYSNRKQDYTQCLAILTYTRFRETFKNMLRKKIEKAPDKVGAIQKATLRFVIQLMQQGLAGEDSFLDCKTAFFFLLTLGGAFALP